MTPITPRARGTGRVIFVALWALGLAAIAALAAGLLPGGWPLLAAIALGLCVTIAIGVGIQGSGFLARPLNRVPGVADRLALTFDDGPDPAVTPRVLEQLAAAGARATFFVRADRLRAHPELARRIREGGHELANHSVGHRWHMALWPSAAIARDLEQASRLIAELGGEPPRFFRPPAAVLSPRIAAGAERAGLVLVGYSTRSLDGSPVVSARWARRRLERGLVGGAILLLHDRTIDGRAPVSLELLPALLEELRRRGLASVTLYELCGFTRA
jgi:peptidoglycan/xylan/chitin deacetylase (PgdA/CDA1 family)